MCVIVVYAAAAAAALLFAAHAASRLARERSLTLAVSVMSMTALSASLGLAAAAPAAALGESGPAGWVMSGLGVTATWGLAQVLAAGNGGARRVGDMVVTPVLGGGSAAFLLLGLQRAGSLGVQESAQSGLAVIGTQLALLTYYGPGLCRIAVFAWRRASSAQGSGARQGMVAVSVSAGAWLVLIVARSAVIVAGSCGLRAGWPVMTVIAVLQGAAVIYGIAAVGAGRVVSPVSSRCGMWVAYWRLRPLWAALLRAVPEVELPAERGVGAGIRWRLLRRVIEIRDAELALRPYWSADVAARASAAARSAALSADLEHAAVEAAVVMDAAGASMRGEPPSSEPVPAGHVFAMDGEDLRSEVARLVQVARAIRRGQPVRELPRRAAPRLQHTPWSARPGLRTGWAWHRRGLSRHSS